LRRETLLKKPDLPKKFDLLRKPRLLLLRSQSRRGSLNSPMIELGGEGKSIFEKVLKMIDD